MKNLATKIRDILIKEGKDGTLDSGSDAETKRIPFIHAFPKNSCEISAYLLGMVAKNETSNAEVRLVKGAYKNQEHFWVLIDELIFDITADQFTGVTEAITGIPKNNLTHYSVEKSLDIETAFDMWDQPNKREWLEFISNNLRQNSKLKGSK